MNKMNIKYLVKERGTYDIFGVDFVKNNQDNIIIRINGKQNELVNLYALMLKC